MALPQQKFREIVFQDLYSLDIGRPNENDMVELLMKELAVTKKIVKQAQERSHHVMRLKEELDELIRKVSFSYEFERIQTVERNILRLGVFELFYDKDIPAKVAISEAMRLARKFGTPESANFINAILDTLYKDNLGEPYNSRKVEDSIDLLNESEEIAKEASLTQPKEEE